MEYTIIDTFDRLHIKQTEMIRKCYSKKGVEADKVSVYILADKLIFDLQGMYSVHSLEERLDNLKEQGISVVQTLSTQEDIENVINNCSDNDKIVLYRKASLELQNALKNKIIGTKQDKKTQIEMFPRNYEVKKKFKKTFNKGKRSFPHRTRSNYKN